MLKPLLGLNTHELRTLAQRYGEHPFRGNQLADWIYRRRVHTLQGMPNLPGGFVTYLKKEYTVGCPDVAAIQSSTDGTLKALLTMSDGAKVETVGLPHAGRFACCVSTQVGCPIACAFCSTGQSGYTRNLTAGEIVGQVLSIKEAGPKQSICGDGLVSRIDHVTFMGMGEPLLNYEPVLKAVRLLNEESGISMRNLTISTVGYVPGIRRLAQEKMQITLAVSLHAATDALRRQLIPNMAKWKVAEIIESCRDYMQQTARRVTFEYCLLGGINDGGTEARQLAMVLRGLNCHVNLIPYNPVPGLHFAASSPKQVRTFRQILDGEGIPVTRRIRHGEDIDAACGQLRRRTSVNGPEPFET